MSEEEHRGDEATGSGVFRERAVRPEAGRAGHPGLSGAGPEADEDQAGPGFKELDKTSGADHQDHQQHPDYNEQGPHGKAGWQGLIQQLDINMTCNECNCRDSPAVLKNISVFVSDLKGHCENVR